MQDAFPACPVEATERLKPITSWTEIYREAGTTGVEFEEFWDQAVHDGVAYFFSWLGRPRATVLVVWEAGRLTHVECRREGDVQLSVEEAGPIVWEVVHAFQRAGFGDSSH